MKRAVSKVAVKHLREDIKGYKKQRNNLKEEISEDRKLIKKIKPKVKKAAPKKVSIAKGVKVTKAKEKKMEKKPGGSNVGDYSRVEKQDFAGKAGGAPRGSYPINTLARARSALRLAHNAPNPAGIRKAVYKKYPSLKKK